MYGWLWRRLPGSPPARLAQAVIILVVLGVLLWYVVYPWISGHLPVDLPGVG
jgi:hypothetical protein